MKTEIKIEEVKVPYCTIHTAVIDKSISLLQEKIMHIDEEENAKILYGWDGDFCTRIYTKDIYRIYSCDKKVFLETEKETFLLKMRLYEFEDVCEKYGWQDFLRISNTDIVNFCHVKNFDMSLTGVIKVNMTNNTRLFVSRRYMNKIRKELCLRK